MSTTLDILPKDFVARMQAQLGDTFEDFAASISKEEQPTTLRTNPLKKFTIPETWKKIPWCKNGYYLPERPEFVKDPHIFAGAYYVQEASSMFLQHALEQTADLTAPLRVLDLCAAPGGKSTLVNSLLNENSYLISNELVRKRLNALSENIVRWGAPNILATNNNPQDFEDLKEFFDIAVIDAPCSGEGMFRKDYKARAQWSEHLVKSCAHTQRSILTSIADTVKPGGLLVYSTCTFSMDENEKNVQWLMENYPFQSVRIPIDASWQIEETQFQAEQYGYRFYFHQTEGEGFFLSCLRKEEHGFKPPKIKLSKKKKQAEKFKPFPKKYLNHLKKWVKDSEKHFYVMQGDQLWALPPFLQEDFKLLQHKLNIELAGIEVGKFKNEKLIPSHHLAMSPLGHEDLPSVELDYEQAISYLRRAEFSLDTSGKQGWFQVSYQGNTLGWIKVLSNRINNYYPMDWRIRKEI
ncbi:rRNA methyltransferase [Rapidithrix thailandica]|uniref:rRNA methyltransferase n=1 Tax=Rapidithrix thailandica TaxID=413964 RepID=A0AAW9S2K4_9BACT